MDEDVSRSERKVQRRILAQTAMLPVDGDAVERGAQLPRSALSDGFREGSSGIHPSGDPHLNGVRNDRYGYGKGMAIVHTCYLSCCTGVRTHSVSDGLRSLKCRLGIRDGVLGNHSTDEEQNGEKKTQHDEKNESVQQTNTAQKIHTKKRENR